MPSSKDKLRTSPPFTCFSGNRIFRLPVADRAWVGQGVLYHIPQHVAECELPTVMLHNAACESQTGKCRAALICFSFFIPGMTYS